MTKFEILKEIEKNAKRLKYDPWDFYRYSLGVCYDNFKKEELLKILHKLEQEN